MHWLFTPERKLETHKPRWPLRLWNWPLIHTASGYRQQVELSVKDLYIYPGYTLQLCITLVPSSNNQQRELTLTTHFPFKNIVVFIRFSCSVFTYSDVTLSSQRAVRSLSSSEQEVHWSRETLFTLFARRRAIPVTFPQNSSSQLSDCAPWQILRAEPLGSSLSFFNRSCQQLSILYT